MFDSWLSSLISKHARSGVLLDSNLLLLYGVGLFDPRRVAREKVTRNYTAEDYRVLSEFLLPFSRILTTPNIVTEASNLAGRLQEDVRIVFHWILGKRLNEQRINLPKSLEAMDEQYIATVDAALDPAYDRLGVTDAAIGVLAEQGLLVLTNDLDLSIYLERREVDCIHYDRILRPIALGLSR